MRLSSRAVLCPYRHTESGPSAAGPETAAPEVPVETETLAARSHFFHSPLSPFTRALDLGLGIHHDVRMPAPQISPHSYGREEIANEDRRPRERMQHGLR